jgi:hypothetical protein
MGLEHPERRNIKGKGNTKPVNRTFQVYLVFIFPEYTIGERRFNGAGDSMGPEIQWERRTISAARMPSMAADMIPPAYPAPSPAGYKPRIEA